jgi:hypothetical protein
VNPFLKTNPNAMVSLSDSDSPDYHAMIVMRFKNPDGDFDDVLWIHFTEAQLRQILQQGQKLVDQIAKEAGKGATCGYAPDPYRTCGNLKCKNHNFPGPKEQFHGMAVIRAKKA